MDAIRVLQLASENPSLRPPTPPKTTCRVTRSSAPAMSLASGPLDDPHGERTVHSPEKPQTLHQPPPNVHDPSHVPQPHQQQAQLQPTKLLPARRESPRSSPTRSQDVRSPSPAVVTPHAAGSTRRPKSVAFSAKTEYKDPPNYEALAATAAATLPATPSMQSAKPAKGILKASSSSSTGTNPFDDLASSDAMIMQAGGLAQRMDPLLEQFASSDRETKLEAYGALTRALKASSSLPDRIALQDHMPQLLPHLQRDLARGRPTPEDASVHGGENNNRVNVHHEAAAGNSTNDVHISDVPRTTSGSMLDASLANHAATLLITILHFPAIASQLPVDFGAFVMDHAIRCLETKSPKDVVRHVLQIVAFQSFPARVMTHERVGRLLSALHRIEEFVTGKSIIMSRVIIYRRLLKQCRAYLVAHTDWLLDLFTDMLSGMRETRVLAVGLGLDAAYALGGDRPIARRVVEILQGSVEEGRPMLYIEFYMERLRGMIKARQDTAVVPRIWSVMVLFLRSIQLDRWQFLNPWMRLIQQCFNLSDGETRQEANLAWNRFVYLTHQDEHYFGKMLEQTLCHPFPSQLKRKTFAHRSEADFRSVVFGSICCLYYYTFQPGTSVAHLDRYWDVSVRPILEAMLTVEDGGGGGATTTTAAAASIVAHGSVGARSGLELRRKEALTILQSLLDHAARKPAWREDRVAIPGLITAAELPCLDAKWLRRSGERVFGLLRVVLTRRVRPQTQTQAQAQGSPVKAQSLGQPPGQSLGQSPGQSPGPSPGPSSGPSKGSPILAPVQGRPTGLAALARPDSLEAKVWQAYCSAILAAASKEIKVTGDTVQFLGHFVTMVADLWTQEGLPDRGDHQDHQDRANQTNGMDRSDKTDKTEKAEVPSPEVRNEDEDMLDNTHEDPSDGKHRGEQEIRGFLDGIRELVARVVESLGVLPFTETYLTLANQTYSPSGLAPGPGPGPGPGVYGSLSSLSGSYGSSATTGAPTTVDTGTGLSPLVHLFRLFAAPPRGLREKHAGAVYLDFLRQTFAPFLAGKGPEANGQLAHDLFDMVQQGVPPPRRKEARLSASAWSFLAEILSPTLTSRTGSSRSLPLALPLPPSTLSSSSSSSSSPPSSATFPVTSLHPLNPLNPPTHASSLSSSLSKRSQSPSPTKSSWKGCSDAPVGREYRRVTRILEYGLTHVPELAWEKWYSLFSALLAHVNEYTGPTGCALAVLEPLAQVLARDRALALALDTQGTLAGSVGGPDRTKSDDRGPGSLPTGSVSGSAPPRLVLQASIVMVASAAQPRDRQSWDLAQRRLWGRTSGTSGPSSGPLATSTHGHGPDSVDPFDHVYSLIQAMLIHLYTCWQVYAGHDTVALFLREVSGFLRRCQPTLAWKTLSRLQPGLALWFQDSQGLLGQRRGGDADADADAEADDRGDDDQDRKDGKEKKEKRKRSRGRKAQETKVDSDESDSRGSHDDRGSKEDQARAVVDLWERVSAILAHEESEPWTAASLASMETLVTAALQSKHRYIVNGMARQWNEIVRRNHGLPMPSPTDTPDRLREVLELVQKHRSVDLILPGSSSFSEDPIEADDSGLAGPSLEASARQPLDVSFVDSQQDLGVVAHIPVEETPRSRTLRATRSLRSQSADETSREESPSKLKRLDSPSTTTDPSNPRLSVVVAGRKSRRRSARHDDSQVDFAPVVTEKPVDYTPDSQLWTEHQRDVRDRQRAEAGWTETQESKQPDDTVQDVSDRAGDGAGDGAVGRPDNSRTDRGSPLDTSQGVNSSQDAAVVTPSRKSRTRSRRRRAQDPSTPTPHRNSRQCSDSVDAPRTDDLSDIASSPLASLSRRPWGTSSRSAFGGGGGTGSDVLPYDQMPTWPGFSSPQKEDPEGSLTPVPGSRKRKNLPAPIDSAQRQGVDPPRSLGSSTEAASSATIDKDATSPSEDEFVDARANPETPVDVEMTSTDPWTTNHLAVRTPKRSSPRITRQTPLREGGQTHESGQTHEDGPDPGHGDHPDQISAPSTPSSSGSGKRKRKHSARREAAKRRRASADTSSLATSHGTIKEEDEADLTEEVIPAPTLTPIAEKTRTDPRARVDDDGSDSDTVKLTRQRVKKRSRRSTAEPVPTDAVAADGPTDERSSSQDESRTDQPNLASSHGTPSSLGTSRRGTTGQTDRTDVEEPTGELSSVLASEHVETSFAPLAKQLSVRERVPKAGHEAVSDPTAERHFPDRDRTEHPDKNGRTDTNDRPDENQTPSNKSPEKKKRTRIRKNARAKALALEADRSDGQSGSRPGSPSGSLPGSQPHGQTDGQPNGQTDGQPNGQTDSQTSQSSQPGMPVYPACQSTRLSQYQTAPSSAEPSPPREPPDIVMEDVASPGPTLASTPSSHLELSKENTTSSTTQGSTPGPIPGSTSGSTSPTKTTQAVQPLPILDHLRASLSLLQDARLPRADMYEIEDVLLDVKRALYEAERRGRE